MRRRHFLGILGSAAAAWPMVARAQQRERMRHIGLLTGGLEADSDDQGRYAVFKQAMQQLGWTEGRNVRYEQRSRFSGNMVDARRRNAAELVALSLDVILVSGARNVEALQQLMRCIWRLLASRYFAALQRKGRFWGTAEAPPRVGSS
jgi:putative ABC transport system substrate-binding protein